MLQALDRIALAAGDADATAAGLQAVLGHAAVRNGEGHWRLQLGNIAVAVEQKGAADTGIDGAMLVLCAADLGKAAHRLARRGLPGTMRDGAGTPRLDLDQAATHGVPIAVVDAPPHAPAPVAGADIVGLDHVVVRTPDPERAVALYGGRLGLDLRLDRVNAVGSRLLFFVCGDLVVEISHDPAKGIGTGQDRIFGFAWRAADIDRAHARMMAAGVSVSELRDGRRPGTRVFTVKSHTAGLPTLVIAGDGLARVR